MKKTTMMILITISLVFLVSGNGIAAGSCKNEVPGGMYGDDIDDHGNITARM